MFVFNNTEERWFLNWVVMRRKFKVSEQNVRELVKDLNYWRNKAYELEIKNKDLYEQLRGRKTVSEFEKTEAEKRQKMIDDFNSKNNKGRRFNKKRKKRRR